VRKKKAEQKREELFAPIPPWLCKNNKTLKRGNILKHLS
jgi:hypothetical protein